MDSLARNAMWELGTNLLRQPGLPERRHQYSQYGTDFYALWSVWLLGFSWFDSADPTFDSILVPGPLPPKLILPYWTHLCPGIQGVFLKWCFDVFLSEGLVESSFCQPFQGARKRRFATQGQCSWKGCTLEECYACTSGRVCHASWRVSCPLLAIVAVVLNLFMIVHVISIATTSFSSRWFRARSMSSLTRISNLIFVVHQYFLQR